MRLGLWGSNSRPQALRYRFYVRVQPIDLAPCYRVGGENTKPASPMNAEYGASVRDSGERLEEPPPGAKNTEKGSKNTSSMTKRVGGPVVAIYHIVT